MEVKPSLKTIKKSNLLSVKEVVKYPRNVSANRLNSGRKKKAGLPAESSCRSNIISMASDHVPPKQPMRMPPYSYTIAPFVRPDFDVSVMFYFEVVGWWECYKVKYICRNMRVTGVIGASGGAIWEPWVQTPAVSFFNKSFSKLPELHSWHNAFNPACSMLH